MMSFSVICFSCIDLPSVPPFVTWALLIMPLVNFLGSVLHSLLSRLLNELDVLHTDGGDVSNILADVRT